MDKKDAERCVICLFDLVDDRHGRMKCCNKKFHFHCMKQWLQTRLEETDQQHKPKCPTCRAPIMALNVNRVLEEVFTEM